MMAYLVLGRGMFAKPKLGLLMETMVDREGLKWGPRADQRKRRQGRIILSLKKGKFWPAMAAQTAEIQA